MSLSLVWVRKVLGLFVPSKSGRIVRSIRCIIRSLRFPPGLDGKLLPDPADCDVEAAGYHSWGTSLLDGQYLPDSLDMQTLSQWLFGSSREPKSREILTRLGKNDAQNIADFLHFAIYDVQTLQTEEISTLISLLETLGVSPNYISLKGLARLDHNKGSESMVTKGKYKYRGGPELRAELMAPNSNISLKVVRRLIYLSHENVLPFYGVYDIGNGRPCVLTPCLDYSLGDYIETHAGHEGLIFLIIGIIMGVGHLHELGMVHGSLRCDNVFVTNQGRALLGTISYDAFLVNTHGQGGDIKSTDMPGSYIRWMAPEQIKSPQSKPTAESDIWAFGCLVYLILTTKNPYHDYICNTQILTSMLRGELPTLDNEKPVFGNPQHEAWWNAMQKCWTPDASRRPDWKMVLEHSNTSTQRPVIDTPVKSTREFWQEIRAKSDINIAIKPGRLRDLLLKSQQVSGEETRLRPVDDLPSLKYQCRSLLDEILQEDRRERRERLIESNDAQLLCDYLDEVYCDTKRVDEQKQTHQRILSLLDRLGKYARVFPHRYLLRDINVDFSKPIAEGGYATVYKGKCAHSTVCLKVMKQTDAKKMSWSYARELTLWAHLSHPNILPFYGVYNVPSFGKLALVSPWMKNGNLHDLAPHLPQILRLPYILGVINGLDFLHLEDLVHGDLKAQNVLISEDGRALITDFGLSGFEPSLMFTANTLTTSTFTGRWAAPEMLLNAEVGTTLPTKPGDIWSLACLIYEVLSTRLPYYKYRYIFGVIAALMGEKLPARPVKGNPSTGEYIEDHLWKLLEECWKFNPEERPTCGDILRGFEILLEAPPRPTHQGSRGTENLHYRRRSKNIDYRRVYQLLRASDVGKGEKGWN